jgi:hypothetical protein
MFKLKTNKQLHIQIQPSTQLVAIHLWELFKKNY